MLLVATKQQLYSHLPPITKTIKIRRTRHAGYCWRSRDELLSILLLWTPSHGRAKTGRQARTYIQQFCADTGCSPEDLPEVMDDREGWHIGPVIFMLIACHDDEDTPCGCYTQSIFATVLISLLQMSLVFSGKFPRI